MSNTFYSEEIVETIRDYLTENDWSFSFDEHRGTFQFGLLLKGKLKQIRYELHVWKDEYVVLAKCPVGVDRQDKTTMANMAEFVCRVNYSLKNGGFELDFRDGEIQYRTFVDCSGISLSSAVIRNSLHCPAVMYERYGTGILDILFLGKTTEEAIKHCEEDKTQMLHELISKLSDEAGDMRALLDSLEEDTDAPAHSGEVEDSYQDDPEDSNLSGLFGGFLDLLPAERTVEISDLPGEEPFD